MTRIDLHTHSTASDGTDTPSELVQLAAASVLDVIALTDHDTTAGWTEAAAAAGSNGVTVLLGVELTARTSSATVHVLGYLFDPSDRALTEEMHKIRLDRVNRAERMVERIARVYPLKWDEVAGIASSDGTIGRPHIADALVARGYVADRPEAFATILSSHSPFYIAHYAPTPLTAVKLIRSAGGVPVLAHPARHRGGSVDSHYLTKLVRAGLSGVEVEHRDNTAVGKSWLRREARRHNLIQTGSSDYHGCGKPNQLGENLTDLKAYERLLNEAAARATLG